MSAFPLPPVPCPGGAKAGLLPSSGLCVPNQLPWAWGWVSHRLRPFH